MKIGFIGAGQMARALASGLVRAKLVPPRDIVAADPSDKALTDFTQSIAGAERSSSNQDVVDTSDIVFLAVKPQHAHDVAASMKVPADTLLVSIVAGLSLDKLQTLFKTERVIRVMPNTPCLIGKGASAFCVGPGVSPSDAQSVSKMLESVGIVMQTTESLMDVVTGLSGSGPAYLYVIIEALADGAVLNGMPRSDALRFAAQTVYGAAAMVLETNEHPGVLKDQVASPGGTTINGIHALEQGRLRATLMNAVTSGTNRSIELGNQ